MLINNGSRLLEEYAKRTFKKEILKVSDRMYYFMGYGHSNATLIIGNTSSVLIDSLDSDMRGKRLRAAIEKITDRPVKTIIFTHGHPDHMGGSGAFADLSPEVIMHKPVNDILPKTEMIAAELARRGKYQFGLTLTDEELITQGMGPREGRASGDGVYSILKPTRILEKDCEELEIEGIKLKVISAPGETDDQMYIWLEDERALASGDNYYPCFPNLYALRGSQYRNIGKWIESLRLILKLRPEILLPGHAKAITGYSQIEKEIGAYADSIEYILNETLKGINEGKTADELALIITLPEELKNNLSFGEHYGCTEWTVRSICDGYLGWFDGNPTSIHRLSPAERGKEMIKMAGGAEKLLKNAKDSLETGRYLWGMELCDHLINADILRNEAIEIKIECCMRLAEMETSANGRHFYQMYAKEFRAYRNS